MFACWMTADSNTQHYTFYPILIRGINFWGLSTHLTSTRPFPLLSCFEGAWIYALVKKDQQVTTLWGQSGSCPVQLTTWDMGRVAEYISFWTVTVLHQSSPNLFTKNEIWRHSSSYIARKDRAFWLDKKSKIVPCLCREECFKAIWEFLYLPWKINVVKIRHSLNQQLEQWMELLKLQKSKPVWLEYFWLHSSSPIESWPNIQYGIAPCEGGPAPCQFARWRRGLVMNSHWELMKANSSQIWGTYTDWLWRRSFKIWFSTVG